MTRLFFSFFVFLFIFITLPPVFAERNPPPLQSSPEYTNFLKERYGFLPSDITWGEKYPVILRGGDEASFSPKANSESIRKNSEHYDLIIVGGGLSGLTSAKYATEKGLKVLVLEKENQPGGLAVGSSSSGTIRYGRGGAYFTDASGKAEEIFKDLGIHEGSKEFKIPYPIDSYLWNGKYYRGLWESDSAMRKLPASFSAFRYVLKDLDNKGLIPVQPFENHPATQKLDSLTFEQWVNSVPKQLETLAKNGDWNAKQILERFKKDSKVDPLNPMKEVLGLLQLYGRSALGDHPNKVSAAAFINFYISEISERLTGSLGTGIITEKLLKQLENRSNLTLKTNSPVAKIIDSTNGVEVFYRSGGEIHQVKASNLVFAAELKLAPKLIENFERTAPKHVKALEKLDYRNYLVVNVHVQGHPWKEAFDLWVRNDSTYSKDKITDIIDGRYVEFEGKHLVRTDDKGVLTVYLPISEEKTGKGFTNKETVQLAEEAVRQMLDSLNPILAKNHQQPIQVLAVEANRWPYSIHVAAPGHFNERVKVLSTPVGNIYFAQNNLGTPSVEEALYRGWKSIEDLVSASKFHKQQQQNRSSCHFLMKKLENSPHL